MGKKLKGGDAIKSMRAVADFRIDAGKTINIKSNIYVYNISGEEIFNFIDKKVSLTITNAYYNVNIIWEDFGISDYCSLGLSGYYSTSFYPMEYDPVNQILKIKAENKVIKIQI